MAVYGAYQTVKWVLQRIRVIQEPQQPAAWIAASKTKPLQHSLLGLSLYLTSSLCLSPRCPLTPSSRKHLTRCKVVFTKCTTGAGRRRAKATGACFTTAEQPQPPRRRPSAAAAPRPPRQPPASFSLAFFTFLRMSVARLNIPCVGCSHVAHLPVLALCLQPRGRQGWQARRRRRSERAT
jgi:hypothetical protein